MSSSGSLITSWGEYENNNNANNQRRQAGGRNIEGRQVLADSAFDYDGKDQEAALMDRLDIVQIEGADGKKDMAGSEQA